MLKISDFYLDKQKSVIPKKILSVPRTMDSSFFSLFQPWCPIFPNPRLWLKESSFLRRFWLSWIQNAKPIKAGTFHDTSIHMTNYLFSNTFISNNNKINQKTKSNSFEGVGFSINIWNLKGIKINKLIKYLILNVWERKSGKVVGKNTEEVCCILGSRNVINSIPFCEFYFR